MGSERGMDFRHLAPVLLAPLQRSLPDVSLIEINVKLISHLSHDGTWCLHAWLTCFLDLPLFVSEAVLI